ncbi:MAG TPA: GyrI-like domain-containing protein [Kribbella sp.]|nr:GyrI-like domain-containing protein [Kribbella sp.]
MDLLEPPRVVERPQRDYLGIRVVTPFRGMLGTRNELIDELSAWLLQESIDDVGPFFLRLHVIDMSGPMDIEVGVITPGPLAGDARVRPAVLPAGGYATLTYRNHSLRANRALIEWAAEQGIAFDRRDVAEGDLFACRYELFRTDPRTEPRKTKWEVELNFRIAEPAGTGA